MTTQFSVLLITLILKKWPQHIQTSIMILYVVVGFVITKRTTALLETNSTQKLDYKNVKTCIHYKKLHVIHFYSYVYRPSDNWSFFTEYVHRQFVYIHTFDNAHSILCKIYLRMLFTPNKIIQIFFFKNSQQEIQILVFLFVFF